MNLREEDLEVYLKLLPFPCKDRRQVLKNLGHRYLLTKVKETAHSIHDTGMKMWACNNI